jgi:hypothetical protein
MRKTVIACLVLILIAGSLSAQDIKLKKSFWSGWKYSVGGLEYEKVGMTGASLRNEMEGNPEAQAEMDIYKGRKARAAITGWSGGLLVGWPLGASIAGAEWTDSYTVMMACGVPLCLISMLLEHSATQHLKEAVRIYNGEGQTVGFDLHYYRPFASTSSGTLMVGVSWQF